MENFSSVLFTLCLLLCLILLTVYRLYLYFTAHFNYFIKQQIPGPKPIPFFGTWYGKWKRELHQIENERLLKYGNLYGKFDGRTPNTVIADPNLLRQILIRDFDLFTNRRPFITNNTFINSGLAILNDKQWKDVRKALRPAFSASKIKQTYGAMQECVDILLDHVHQAVVNCRQVNLKKLMGAYTLDMIASCIMGSQLDSLSAPDALIVKKAMKMFSTPVSRNPLYSITLMYPGVGHFIPNSQLLFATTNFFVDLSREILSKRKEMTNSSGLINSIKRNDFLSLLLEAAEDPNSPLADEDILLSQILMFLVAGFDTTSTLLTMILYSLAMHPNVQERLRKELHDALEKHGSQIPISSINDLKYLDQCISETLRLYSPVVRVERICKETVTYGSVTIRKGTLVTVPIYAIHHNPKIYADPYKFDPERFAKKDKLDNMTYLPFGQGLRSCIGQHFALQVVKIALAHVLERYRITRIEKTTKIPAFYEGVLGLMQPKKILVGIENAN